MTLFAQLFTHMILLPFYFPI